MADRKATPSKADRKAPAPAGAAQSRTFERIVSTMRGGDGIEEPRPSRRAFGSNALKVHGKIFAMLVGDALVLKLPKERVDGLVASGAGAYFDPTRRRPMKEWVSMHGAQSTWPGLTREAHDFVKATSRTKRPR